MKKQKIILVDNVGFLRNALKNILLSIGNVEIIAEARNGNEFIELLDKFPTDIAFIDIKLPTDEGIEITKAALKKNPKLTIIAFSSVDKQCYIDQIIAAGAKGYLSKCENNYNVLVDIIKDPKSGYFFSNEKYYINPHIEQTKCYT
ncbi:MAG: response regulator transcription factor [Bacteroidales bacterium]